MVTDDEWLDKLGTSRLFTHIDKQALTDLVALGTQATYPEGKALVTCEQENPYLFYVIAGTLDVLLPESEERFSEIKLSTFKAGDCFGEYSIVDAAPASASVVAKTEVQLFYIERSALLAFLDANPSVGKQLYYNLLRLLVVRLRSYNHELDLFQPY